MGYQPNRGPPLDYVDRRHVARHARHAAWNGPGVDSRSLAGASVPIVAQTPAELTAEAVRVELARRRISGRAMARALGWSFSSTARLLKAEYAFDIDELSAVADFLNLPLTALLPPVERVA